MTAMLVKKSNHSHNIRAKWNTELPSLATVL
jgi:hypothetical protein